MKNTDINTNELVIRKNDELVDEQIEVLEGEVEGQESFGFDIVFLIKYFSKLNNKQKKAILEQLIGHSFQIDSYEHLKKVYVPE